MQDFDRHQKPEMDELDAASWVVFFGVLEPQQLQQATEDGFFDGQTQCGRS